MHISGDIIRGMARDFYRLDLAEVQLRFNALEKWPASRNIDRVVPIQEAIRRLKKAELRELVILGFVVIVECAGQLFPARTFDVMTGTNSDEAVSLAKKDLMFEIAIKGARAPLDSGLVS